MATRAGLVSLGRVILQEDPGGSSRLAKVWLYDTMNGGFFEIAAHDAALFEAGAPNFITTNEESSGVIPVFDVLGVGWNLHHGSGPRGFGGSGIGPRWTAPGHGRRSEPGPRVRPRGRGAGTGSFTFKHRFGTPHATAFSPVALAAGNFLNGAFFGIDISILDIPTQASFGSRFLVTLDGAGNSTSATFTNLPLGLTLYGVAIDEINAAQPRASSPTFFAIQ